MSLQKCRKCNHVILETAKICSSCGAPNTRPLPLFWILVSILMMAIGLTLYQGTL